MDVVRFKQRSDIQSDIIVVRKSLFAEYQIEASDKNFAIAPSHTNEVAGRSIARIAMYCWVFNILLVCWVGSTFGIERFDIVTTVQLERMLEERRSGATDFILVNALDRIIYRDQAIPGSVNIPWAEIEKHAGNLGDDKKRLIVTYCMGYR